MGCVGSCFKKVFISICALLKVCLATAIIIIVATRLYKVDVTVDKANGVKAEADCLMSGSVRGASMCEYAYAVCGLSLLLSLVLSIFLCVTCDMCGAGGFIELGVGALQTAWWVIASIVFAKKSAEGDDAQLPNQDSRIAVNVLSFICAALSALMTLVYLVEAIKCLKDCLCCCACCQDDDEEKRRATVA